MKRFPSTRASSMTHRAPRIRHYIGSIVAGCSVGGLALAFGLAFLVQSIEDRSREAEGLSRSLWELGHLRRSIESFAAEARDTPGGKAAQKQALAGQDLLLSLGKFREAVGSKRCSADLDEVERWVKEILEGLNIGVKYSSEAAVYAEKLAELRGGLDVRMRRLSEALVRVHTAFAEDQQALLQQVEERRDRMWRTVVISALSYVVLVLCLWRWTVSRLIRPLQILTEESRRTLSGEKDFRLDPRGPYEVRLLTASLSGLVGSLVAARGHLEEKVRERTSELERASRAKDEFLANMSHEIRTPMTAILGYAELCLAPDTPEDDRQRYAEIIFANGEHLLSVINDILDVSKIEAGRMTVEPTLCSPFEVVSEVKALMEVPSREKGLELSVRNESPIPEVVRTDPTRLRQILLNLVNNAIKFTDEGSVAIAFSMEPRANGEEWLVFEVRDTGVGMSDGEIERVFRPFIQADSSTTRKYGGTGLGLAISQALARLLGGELTCKSEPGGGSIFRVTIDPGPLAGVRRLERFPSRARSPRSTVRRSVGPVPPMRGRVLLAEDVAVNRRLVSLILERAGIEVEAAENGRVALEKALAARSAGAPYDIVFMDMQMPEMDGYEATARLRAEGYDRPIVALTSHSLPEERERCLAAGCDEYMTKPVDRLALLRILARYLKDSQEGDDRRRAS